MKGRPNIEPARLLHVEMEIKGVLQSVGRLAWREGRIFFEYEPAFAGLGLPLSPFHLPLGPGVLEGRRDPFEGLHGVFNDSLPDGWGRLLLDRKLSQMEISPSSLTPLDRLACVGRRGMGALRYRPEYPVSKTRGTTKIDLDRLAEEARTVLEGESDQVLESLLDLGGSSGGARPKVLVGCSEDRTRLIHGVDELPDGYTHWLVKFRSSTDPVDVGAVEYAYSKMAKAAGIEMTSTFLFPSKTGPGHFGTERFDRERKARVHVHTVCGLLYADHRLPTIGYETLLKTARALTRSQPEVERIFHRMVFNVFACNRDDHTKNHAFLMDEGGVWRASPTYDVTFSSGPGGEHSLDVGGEGRRPGIENILAVAKATGVSEVFARGCIEQVKESIARWPKLASESGVSRGMAKMIDKQLNGPRRRQTKT